MRITISSNHLASWVSVGSASVDISWLHFSFLPASKTASSCVNCRIHRPPPFRPHSHNLTHRKACLRAELVCVTAVNCLQLGWFIITILDRGRGTRARAWQWYWKTLRYVFEPVSAIRRIMYCTEIGLSLTTWFGEVRSCVLSKDRNKLHQTTY